MIELLKKDGAVLDIMTDAEFVEDARRNYDDTIDRLYAIICQIWTKEARSAAFEGIKEYIKE